MPPASSTSTRRTPRARTISRTGYALRTCLGCRKSKMKCRLPDLTVASSSSPLLSHQACHRCLRLALPCVVDDSQRRATKKGTARYGLDGLLERSAGVNFDLASNLQPPLSSTACSTSPDARLYASVRGSSIISRTPETCQMPDPLRPGSFDLVYPDVNISLAYTAAACTWSSSVTSSAASSSHPSLSPVDTNNTPFVPPSASSRPSSGAPSPSHFSNTFSALLDELECLHHLQRFNPFLFRVTLVHSPTDLLHMTLRHLRILLSCASDSARSHAGRRSDPSPQQMNTESKLAESRNSIMAYMTRFFLGHQPPSLRAIQALILLCRYDPPDLFLPPAHLQQDDAGFSTGSAPLDSSRLSDACLPPPGLPLVQLACTMADQIGLPSCISTSDDHQRPYHSARDDWTDRECFLTNIALYNLRIGYALSEPSRSSSINASRPLLGVRLGSTLDTFERVFTTGSCDADPQDGRQIAVEALLLQFQMNHAFAHAVSTLQSFTLPISANSSKVEDLHSRFRQVSQAAITRFAQSERDCNSGLAQRQWARLLRVEAADMELSLWSHCIYLELSPPVLQSNNVSQKRSTHVWDYAKVFVTLQARDYQGAKFLSTVTERCTDLANAILHASKVLLRNSDETASHDHDEVKLHWAPLVTRCSAIFKATKTVSQLWMMVLLNWSSLPARLEQSLQMLDDAAEAVKSINSCNKPKLACVVQQFVIRTNDQLQLLYQSKLQELSKKNLEMLHRFVAFCTPTNRPDRNARAVSLTHESQAATGHDRSQSPMASRDAHSRNSCRSFGTGDNENAVSSFSADPSSLLSLAAVAEMAPELPSDAIDWDDLLSWGFLNVTP